MLKLANTILPATTPFRIKGGRRRARAAGLLPAPSPVGGRGRPQVRGKARSMQVLSASNIQKRFGGVVALSKGEFALDEGEVHVLVGSNGCGKSTLCKIIAEIGRAHV